MDDRAFVGMRGGLTLWNCCALEKFASSFCHKRKGHISKCATRCTVTASFKCQLHEGHDGDHVDFKGNTMKRPTTKEVTDNLFREINAWRATATSIKIDHTAPSSHVSAPNHTTLLSLAEELTRELGGIGMSPRATVAEERARRDLLSKAMRTISLAKYEISGMTKAKKSEEK